MHRVLREKQRIEKEKREEEELEMAALIVQKHYRGRLGRLRVDDIYDEMEIEEEAKKKKKQQEEEGEWIEYWDDESSVPYWYHSGTGEVSYEKQGADEQTTAANLWTEKFDVASGYPYWVHNETGESTWEAPAETYAYEGQAPGAKGEDVQES